MSRRQDRATSPPLPVKTPHLLNAGSNCRKLLAELSGILPASANELIEDEINRNAIALFKLGEGHFLFAKGLNKALWRQKISRLYYGAYNARRAINLHGSGKYSVDVSDHKNIDSLPGSFPNSSTYSVQLPTLRNDRNLADYDHEAVEADLLISVEDAEDLVTQFLSDVANYLTSKGLTL